MGEAEEKAEKHKGVLGRGWDDLTTMIRLVRAYATCAYRDLPWRTIVMILGAVLYFVSPIDLIPDFIPVAGFLDDAAILSWVASAAHDDLERFRTWESGRRAKSRER